MYKLILTEYVLWSPDSNVLVPGPAGLLASNSGTAPHIEPNHTQAGLFNTAPLYHWLPFSLLLLGKCGGRSGRSCIVCSCSLLLWRLLLNVIWCICMRLDLYEYVPVHTSMHWVRTLYILVCTVFTKYCIRCCFISFACLKLYCVCEKYAAVLKC